MAARKKAIPRTLTEDELLANATAAMKEEIFPTTSVQITDIIGVRYLTGCDYGEEGIEDPDAYDGDGLIYANVIRFTLDGITYKAMEDPNDGYRSSCGNLERNYDKIRNSFDPHKVIVRMQENNNTDIIEIVDAVTNEVVIMVGTDNSDDYYPCCIMSWNPENLACNIGKQKEML